MSSVWWCSVGVRVYFVRVYALSYCVCVRKSVHFVHCVCHCVCILCCVRASVCVCVCVCVCELCGGHESVCVCLA